MPSSSDQLTTFSNTIVAWLPRLIGALIILLVGYLISAALRSIVIGALRRMGVNRKIKELPENNVFRRLTPDLARVTGEIVYWVAILVSVSLAIIPLGSSTLNSLVHSVYLYIPNIIAALIILVVAALISAGVAGAAHRLMGDTPTGKVVATAVPVIVMAIAVFMILEQLRIAPSIVIITYVALIGSLAVGFALAFGLGGQSVASKMLESAYQSGQKNIGQIREDIQKGQERGRKEATKYKRKLEEE